MTVRASSQVVGGVDVAKNNIVPPNPTVMNIFRKRMGLPPIGDGGGEDQGPVKCLFGKPDEEVCTTMSQKVEERHQWAFSKKWNFNITGKEAPTTLVPSSASDAPSQYDWSESVMRLYLGQLENESQLSQSKPINNKPRKIQLSKPKAKNTQLNRRIIRKITLPCCKCLFFFNFFEILFSKG